MYSLVLLTNKSQHQSLKNFKSNKKRLGEKKKKGGKKFYY